MQDQISLNRLTPGQSVPRPPFGDASLIYDFDGVLKLVSGDTGLKETLLTTIGAASTDDVPLVPSFFYDGTDTTFLLGNIPGSYASYGNLTQVYLGNSVTSIGDYAFRNNSLTSVTIPNSVTSIGDYAFGYNSLTSVTIPNSVTSIGSYAFNSNSLTSVTIPNSVTTIGFAAFQSNSLTSVTIPNSVTSIGNAAFNSNSLTSVTIPNSVTSIGSLAFQVNSLTSVTIPNSVTSIGSYAFAYNATLVTVNCLVTKTIIDAATKIFSNTASPLTINARASDGTWTAGTGLSIGGNTNVTVAKNL